MSNQRIYMQIRNGAEYWLGSNADDHPTHSKYWSEVRHITQAISMDIAGVNSSGGPQASGRVAHEDMIVLKDVDRMTPRFYDFTCRGQGIDVILEVFDLTAPRPAAVATKPNFVFILRGVSITSQKITDARTTFERREYNLTNTTGPNSDLLTGFTDVDWTSPRTIARETVTFLYSDLFMEIFGEDTASPQAGIGSLADGYWDATKNNPLGKPVYTRQNNTSGQGPLYSW